MEPSIGRIVHYEHITHGTCVAIILDFDPTNKHSLCLQVFAVGEEPWQVKDAMFDETPNKIEPNTWHWPPRS